MQPGLACKERDLFSKEVPSNSQLEATTNAPTLKYPGVPVQTLEIEKFLQSLNISCWAEDADNSKEPSTEGQEEKQVDHSHPLCSVESLPSEDSRQLVLMGSHQSEKCDQDVRDIVQVTKHSASIQDTSHLFSGHS